MKVGVTGATGHIGYVICQQLLGMGYEVVALVRQVPNHLKLLPITLVQGDILDLDSLKKFMSQCDVVIHTAALIGLSHKFNQKVYDVNVVGTKNILTLAFELRLKKLIHFSSIHAFCHAPHDQALDEQRAFVGNDAIFYDITKRDGHLLALDAAKNGLDVVVLCPTSVIGAPDYRPSKIGKAVVDIYKGSVPAIIKGGFDFVDVQEVAKAAIVAIEKGRKGETYIIGGAYHSIQLFSDYVLEAKGLKKRLVILPKFLALIGLPFVKLYAFVTKKEPLYDKLYLDILEDGNSQIISTKAATDLGLKQTPLKKIIFTLTEWFKGNGKI